MSYASLDSIGRTSLALGLISQQQRALGANIETHLVMLDST